MNDAGEHAGQHTSKVPVGPHLNILRLLAAEVQTSQSLNVGYAHINLLSMLLRFKPEEIVRVAKDSLYIQKRALHKQEGVEAYTLPFCMEELDEVMKGLEVLLIKREVCLAQWHDKGQKLYLSNKGAEYYPKPEHLKQAKLLAQSTALRFNDPVSRLQLSYLNGGGGSWKTIRAIDIFWVKEPLCDPNPTSRQRDIGQGVKAQTYTASFGGVAKADRMGQKFIPHVIIWDGVCMVPQPILETFLDWFDGRGVQVICCDDQGQPPLTARILLHSWLWEKADYYKGVEVNYCVKGDELKSLTRSIGLQSDKV